MSYRIVFKHPEAEPYTGLESVQEVDTAVKEICAQVVSDNLAVYVDDPQDGEQYEMAVFNLLLQVWGPIAGRVQMAESPWVRLDSMTTIRLEEE